MSTLPMMFIAGVGAMAYKVFQDALDPDVILVPMSGWRSGGVCGKAIVSKHLFDHRGN